MNFLFCFGFAAVILSVVTGDLGWLIIGGILWFSMVPAWAWSRRRSSVRRKPTAIAKPIRVNPTATVYPWPGRFGHPFIGTEDSLPPRQGSDGGSFVAGMLVAEALSDRGDGNGATTISGVVPSDGDDDDNAVQAASSPDNFVAGGAEKGFGGAGASGYWDAPKADDDDRLRDAATDLAVSAGVDDSTQPVDTPAYEAPAPDPTSAPDSSSGPDMG